MADVSTVMRLLQGLGIAPTPEQKAQISAFQKQNFVQPGEGQAFRAPKVERIEAVVPHWKKLQRNALGQWLSRKPVMSEDLLIAKRGGMDLTTNPKAIPETMDWLTPVEQTAMKQVPTQDIGRPGTQWEQLSKTADSRIASEDYLRNLPLPSLQNAVRQILKLRSGQ